MNCRELKAVYGCCDYFVGTRFHSVIFSLGCGVPGIAIAYVGNKTQGIMHDIGLDDYVMHIDAVTAAELESKFMRLVGEEEVLKNKIASYQEYSNKQYESL